MGCKLSIYGIFRKKCAGSGSRGNDFDIAMREIRTGVCFCSFPLIEYYGRFAELRNWEVRSGACVEEVFANATATDLQLVGMISILQLLC